VSDPAVAVPSNANGDAGQGWTDAPAAPAAPSDAAARSVPASATVVPQGSFTFTIDSSWSEADRPTVAAWVNPNGLVRKTILKIAGRPMVSANVTVVYDPNNGFAGQYQESTHTLVMGSLSLGVFVHEMMHATHGPWIINNSTWEEGLARAGEIAALNLLVAQSYPGSDEGFHHHLYSYDQYYDGTNVPDVAVKFGSIYGYGEPALPLMRYQQGGYAFGKLLIENPKFWINFDQHLFAQPNGNLTAAQLKPILASVVTNAEGQSFSAWFARQYIFGTAPPMGCRVFQRISQWTLDVFCRDSNGFETAQGGVVATLKAYAANGSLLYTASDTTQSTYGWASFNPTFGSYVGRVKVVGSAALSGGTVSSTYYRTSYEGHGVFGVVTNILTGTATFSSPGGKFATFSVPVSNGAFEAPSLESVAGRVQIAISGGGKSVTLTRTKDAAPLFVKALAA
jgi:hypothetical protein